MKKFLLSFLLVLLAASTAWAEEVVYKTLTFSSETNNKGVSAYNATWTATCDDFTWNIANFNNNNNGWKYVKCGSKSTTSVATITSKTAIDKPITKIVVTFGAVTATSVNSINVYASKTTDFTSSTPIPLTVAQGEQTAKFTTPAENLYYQISVDCKKGSSNGFVQINKVEYYFNNDEGGDPSTEPSISASNLDFGIAEAGAEKTIEVVTANLEEDAIYEFERGASSSFEATGDIAANGTSTLTIKLKDNAEIGTHTDNLEITDGTTSKTVKVTAFIDGTFDVFATLVDASMLEAGETSVYDYTTVGYITEVTTAWNDTYKNLTFKFADDADEDVDFITVYRGAAAEGTFGELLEKGDKVSVTGKLQNYNGSYQFVAGSVVTLLDPANKETAIMVDDTKNVFEGKTIELNATVNSGAALTYSSDDESVATVDADGIVTGVAEGTANITVTAPAYNGYPEKTATVVVNVKATPDYILYESFDTNDGKGGNDDSWSGSIANATFKSDNEGWTVANGNGADNCVKFGTGKAQGSATTPKFDLISGTADCLLTFKAAAWDGSSEKTSLNLSINGGGTLSEASVELQKGAWTEYSVVITGATANTQVTFAGEANIGNNRFFLDEVLVREAVTINISDAGIATFCFSNGLAFSEVEGITAFTAAAGDEVVTLNAIEDVAANTGVILVAEEGKYVVPCKKVAAFNGQNDLVGVTADTEVAANEAGKTNYILARKNGASDYAFYRLENAHTLAAGKAYLSIAITTKAPKLNINFGGEANGIESVEVENTVNGAAYNVLGQKVNDSYKGLVIKNGKKAIVK